MNNLAQSSWSLSDMGRALVACGLALAIASPAALAQQAPAADPKARKTHRIAPKPAVPESIPEVTLPAPPPPARRVPEQMPPGVPQVSWDGSQLTISADNSTLADILVAIRARTGADIDVPANASRERIAARLGPGPAREVIATLLSWTDFDYVIQASDTDPLGIQSVLLTPRSKSSDAVVASSGYGPSPRRTNPRFNQANASPAETPAPDNSASSDAETPVAAVQPAPAESQPVAAVTSEAPPPQVETPSSTASAQASLSPTPAALQSNLSSSAASSADQRIQTLQSLYEQRKQMMQDARKGTPAN